MISRPAAAILLITVPCIVLVLAVVATRVTWIILPGVLFPLGFVAYVFVGYVWTMFRNERR